MDTLSSERSSLFLTYFKEVQEEEIQKYGPFQKFQSQYEKKVQSTL